MSDLIIIDVTDRILHHAILIPNTSYTTYTKFCEQNPVVQTYTDEDCDVSVLHTNEVWRKIWLTMIVICYDVRIYNYILHPDTFKSGNMVIDNHSGELKFRKLKVYVNKPANAADLVAIATKIQDSFGVKPVLKEVELLIKALKQPVGSHDCPVKKTKPFIRCNYALMDNLMRKDFLIWLWYNFNDHENEQFRSKWSYYCKQNLSWRGDVSRVEGSAVHLIYDYKNPETKKSPYPGIRPIELSKFIRHALIHLSDAQHKYEPDVIVYVLQGCLGDFIPKIQDYLYQNEDLLPADLFLFEPAEH